MIESLEIFGLRGFATSQTLSPAMPTGQPGSGLTTIVGPNNSGKSTVIEAFRVVASNENPSFSQGKRNVHAGDKVVVRSTSGGLKASLESLRPGSSETLWKDRPDSKARPKILVLQARRTFSPFFGKSVFSRSQYSNSMGVPVHRSSEIGSFTYRLFTAEQNRDAFNRVLARVISPVPDWSIDYSDAGQHFLKFNLGISSHSSEGLGEGLVSLFFLIDALYDSSPGDVIVIDEPELSLHPALQKRLAILFDEYAQDRQLIVSTHSPYFINLHGLANGAKIVRVHVDNGSKISALSPESATWCGTMLGNLNNPHVLGLNAQEVFFLDDRVVLVEGQEDVVFYGKILKELGLTLNAEFYGWGVGGASNMGGVARLLSDLGFKRVVGILDANEAHRVADLNRNFPSFKFLAIPANDVRSKSATPAKPSVDGLLDSSNTKLRPEHLEPTRTLFQDVGAYLSAQ